MLLWAADVFVAAVLVCALGLQVLLCLQEFMGLAFPTPS